MDVMARLSLKADAQRYFLGYLWWILEPLLWVAVFYLVFEVLLGSGRANFFNVSGGGQAHIYLVFKSVNQAANSLTASRGLIGNTDSPRWLFPGRSATRGFTSKLRCLRY